MSPSQSERNNDPAHIAAVAKVAAERGCDWPGHPCGRGIPEFGGRDAECSCEEHVNENPPPIERLPDADLVAKLPATLWVQQCPVCGEWEWADDGLHLESVEAPEPSEQMCLHTDDYGDESVPMINRRMIVTLAPAEPIDAD